MADAPKRPEPDELASEGVFGRWSRKHGPRQADEHSSRVTPDDRIPGERREHPRREEDLVRIKALQRRYQFLRRIALTAVTCYALMATVGLIALAIYASNSSSAATTAEHASGRSSRAAQVAERAAQEAASVRRVAAAIQAERHSAILDNCQAQNDRHRKTIATLFRIVRHLPPRVQRRARASVGYNILLIDALQPHQNCRALVKQQTTSPVPRHPNR